LDDTRIHPDDYGIARKMAADALEEEEDEGVAQVEAIIRRPQKLEDIGVCRLRCVSPLLAWRAEADVR
jgi:transcriptional accessory protein Tex/SPT6